MIRLIPSLVCIVLGAIFLAIPSISRRGLLFAVPVPAGFRLSSIGRRSIKRYRALIAICVLAVVGAILSAPLDALGTVIVVSPIAMVGASLAGFYWQMVKLRPFAEQHSQVREAELSRAPEAMPQFVWFSAGPFILLAAAAAFLHANWGRIPARFPMHWDFNGQPNGWAVRTVQGVYGPLIFGCEMCVFVLLLALGGWFGARRSQLRRIMLGVLIACNSMIGLIFAGIAVEPVFHWPVPVIVLVPLVILGLILFMATKKISHTGETVESTPQDRWKGGVIYYNPGDPALFVEKRAGLGYTLNFGNRWSWALMAGIVAMVASVPVLF